MYVYVQVYILNWEKGHGVRAEAHAVAQRKLPWCPVPRHVDHYWSSTARGAREGVLPESGWGELPISDSLSEKSPTVTKEKEQKGRESAGKCESREREWQLIRLTVSRNRRGQANLNR